MEPSAIELTCEQCGAAFLLTAAEERFRQDRGLQSPRACPDCRSRGRALRNADLISLYERSETADLLGAVPRDDVRRAGNGAQPRTERRGAASRQLYPAVCDACGAETQVPFIPRGDRPVYCKTCYNAQRGR